MENFHEELAEILEVDIVEDNQELELFECWDSLTLLSILAFVNEKYDLRLSAEEVIDSKTIEGLKKLVKGQIQ